MISPRVLSYGLGVDSTALLIELCSMGRPPDLVLTADPGSEKRASYETMERMAQWMNARNIRYEIVKYQVKHHRQSPPYSTLIESLLINRCLPSIAFGRHSCSLRFKVSPQEAFLRTWRPALDTWAAGRKVTKIIGLDAGPRDTARYAHAASRADDPLFDYDYPLQTWNWDREACKRRIAAEGLPIPRKSSCVFCTGMRASEFDDLEQRDLRLIVLLEARAAPRLRTVEGLWRKSTKHRPGRMTDFIAANVLLPPDQIHDISTRQVLELETFLANMATMPFDNRIPLRTWLDQFEAKYAGRPSSLAA